MNSVSFKKNLLGVQEELLRFAYKLTADREEANDLLQETSLKALDNEDKYIPDTNFKGWMYTIMYNPQIQISAESETKRSIFREKDKTKRSKKESAQHSKSRNKSFVMTSVSAL